MFDYTVFKENSPEEFKKACKKIESLFPNATKKRIVIDVDGSTIQTYTENGKDINVFDDYDVGAVFIESELDLSSTF